MYNWQTPAIGKLIEYLSLRRVCVICFSYNNFFIFFKLTEQSEELRLSGKGGICCFSGTYADPDSMAEMLYKSQPSLIFYLMKPMGWIKKMAAQRAVLTHMHITLDYNIVNEKTPEPAYDGMVFEYDGE